jgi:hypothetical protein
MLFDVVWFGSVVLAAASSLFCLFLREGAGVQPAEAPGERRNTAAESCGQSHSAL